MTLLKKRIKYFTNKRKFRTDYTFVFLLMIFVTSCLSPIEECDPKDRKIAFSSDSAQFKKEVINSMPSYILLKKFIIKNLATILSLNDKKSRSITKRNDGTLDTTLSPSFSYAFFDYGKGEEIKDQVPPNLYPELEKIYKNFNETNFYAVHFSRDSLITISITNPSEYIYNGLIGINHSLEWRPEKYASYNYITDSTSLSRDTLINGAVYKVFIDCYQGW